MTLLSLDLGTTHLKAGLFDLDGRVLAFASRDVAARASGRGYAGYDPDEVWRLLGEAVRAAAAGGGPPQALGIASMAETGLLLDRRSGAARTPLIPWFDPIAALQAEQLRTAAPAGAFLRRGLRASYKPGLMKLLWLKEQAPALLEGAIWLSAADYAAYRLAGQYATDPSLASRTYALDISRAAWDADWLAQFGLPLDLFPPIAPDGQPVGGLTPAAASVLGLPVDLPVVIAGHDHIVGAFAAHAVAGAGSVDTLFDSLGTAESLVGLFPARELTAADDASGFSFGRYVRSGWLYWIGGLSAAGGSLEWLRGILNEPRLDYAGLERLAASVPDEPTGILYYPYLAGSGSPHSDSLARGAFLGLSAAHTRGHLARAVIEGLAFEVEFMRRRAEQAGNGPAQRILTAGGGVYNRAWLQLKADVSGCVVEAFDQPETTLLGAALLAGLGAGVYAGRADLSGRVTGPPTRRCLPDPDRHAAYRRVYEERFARWMDWVRAVR